MNIEPPTGNLETITRSLVRLTRALLTELVGRVRIAAVVDAVTQPCFRYAAVRHFAVVFVARARDEWISLSALFVDAITAIDHAITNGRSAEEKASSRVARRLRGM